MITHISFCIAFELVARKFCGGSTLAYRVYIIQLFFHYGGTLFCLGCFQSNDKHLLQFWIVDWLSAQLLVQKKSYAALYLKLIDRRCTCVLSQPNKFCLSFGYNMLCMHRSKQRAASCRRCIYSQSPNVLSDTVEPVAALGACTSNTRIRLCNATFFLRLKLGLRMKFKVTGLKNIIEYTEDIFAERIRNPNQLFQFDPHSPTHLQFSHSNQLCRIILFANRNNKI